MLQFFLNLFNNCATVAFLICYLIFAEKTVPGSNGQENPSKGRVKLKYWTAAGILALVAFAIVNYRVEDSKIIELISSIFAGIAMALFIGRLNNKFIRPSIFVILCLYTYMAIQTLFPLWEYSGKDSSIIVLLSTNLAFIFKIVFYLFILWLFRSGRLLFYFKEVRELNGYINDQWRKFEKIS